MAKSWYSANSEGQKLSSCHHLEPLPLVTGSWDFPLLAGGWQNPCSFGLMVELAQWNTLPLACQDALLIKASLKGAVCLQLPFLCESRFKPRLTKRILRHLKKLCIALKTLPYASRSSAASEGCAHARPVCPFSPPPVLHGKGSEIHKSGGVWDVLHQSLSLENCLCI